MQRWILGLLMLLMFVSCSSVIRRSDNNQVEHDNTDTSLATRIDTLESEVVRLNKDIVELQALVRNSSQSNQTLPIDANQLTTASAEATIKYIWDSGQGYPTNAGDFDGKRPLSFVRFVSLQMMSDYQARATFITIWDCPVVIAYNSNLRCYSPYDLGTDGFENIAEFNKSPEGWVLTRIVYRIWDNNVSSVDYNMPIVR
jgi:hypothetical protein